MVSMLKVFLVKHRSVLVNKTCKKMKTQIQQESSWSINVKLLKTIISGIIGTILEFFKKLKSPRLSKNYSY